MNDLGTTREPRARGPEIFVFSTSLPNVEALSSALRAQHYVVTAFLDVSSFLATARGRNPDAIVIDVATEDLRGAEVIEKLCPGLCAAPVIVCGPQSDVPPALPGCDEACPLRILRPPVVPDRVIGCIRDMLIRVPGQDAATKDTEPILPKGWGIEHGLTRRERDVLQQIVRGLSSKEAARELGISPRTVEVHRSHLLGKLGAKNVADLVRIALARRPGN